MTIVVGPPAPIVTALADLAAATEIKGTAQAGTTVKVYDNGGATPIATGTVAADGTFDVTTAARLPQGAHALTATVFEGDTPGLSSAPITVIVRSAGTSEYGISTNVSFTLAADEHYLTFLGNADLTGTGTGTKNVFTGNTGHNTFVGGTGDNDYFIHHSDDVITATLNPGHVNRVYADVSFTLPANVQELVLLGSGNLTGTGNSLDNVIYSNSGRDILIGGGGNDTFVVHDRGDKVIAAADGGNNAVFADVSFVLPDNVKTLVLLGSDNLTATGNNLGNALYSNTGVDTLIGGTGTNTFIVHNSNDVVIASPDSPKNTVYADVSFTLPANVQQLILFGSGNLTGNGNSLDNTVTANTGNDGLFGRGGNDTFLPGPGQNSMDGGGGVNTIEFTGMRSDYRTTGLPGGSLQIVDKRDGSPDGTSTTGAVQYFKFTDGTLTPSTPIATGSSMAAQHSQTFAAASLFSVTDPLVDVMATYALWDSGLGSGHFLLDGVDQGTSREIDVTAGELGRLVYQSGSSADVLYVRANNGFQWGPWSDGFAVTAPIDGAPVATPVTASMSVARGQSLAAAGLFNVNDPENDRIVAYDFWNSGTGRAHFVVNGASQGTNQDVYVNAAQLAQTTYQSGPGTDTIWVRAYDGILWGSWSQPFTVTAPIPAQPVLSVTSDNDAERGGAVPLSELVSISDPEQAGFQTLELWDSNGNPGTGQLLVNGMPQTGGHEIDVAPADVAGTVFNVGTLGGTDTLWARLLQSDGQLTPWQSFIIAAPPAGLPSLTVNAEVAAARGDTLGLAALLTISDLDQAGFQMLHLWDSNGTVGGGQFTVTGVPQTGGHQIDVAPADLPNTFFNVGTLGGTDTVYAQLLQWNGELTPWKSITVTAQKAQLPSISVSDEAHAVRGSSIALANLVSIADPDRVSFDKLQLWDSFGGNAFTGEFVVNGAPQGGGHAIDVLPSDIGNTFFNVGTLGGSDLLWARLIESNGQATEWKSFSVTAPLARLPSLSVSDTLAARGDSIALSTLVRVTDTDSVGFQALHLWDSNGTIAGGRFVVGDVPQTGGHAITLTPSDLAKTVFNVGTLGGSDQLWAQIVQANGELSSWVPFTVTAPVAQLPTLVVQDDRTATAGETIALARLVTVVDPENVGFQSVQLWDSNGTPAGGQFVIGETPQTGGHIIQLAPADLANTVFHVGTLGATDLLWAQIVQSNGQASGWQPFKIEVAVDDAATTLDATFRSAGGVKFVEFKFDYDPELLTVADAERGADLPDTARISLRTTETEDGAEAYITLTSDEPIPAGTVKLASISVSPRSAGRHLDGLRKLHVQHVNDVSSRETEKVRISIADLGPSASENLNEDSELVDASYPGDDVAPRIRLKMAQFDGSGDLAAAGGVEEGAPSEEDRADLAAVVRIANPHALPTDLSPSPLSLERSHRWKFERSTDGSAANLSQSVRIPLVSVTEQGFAPGSTRM
jgi:hypothetical protein